MVGSMQAAVERVLDSDRVKVAMRLGTLVAICALVAAGSRWISGLTDAVDRLTVGQAAFAETLKSEVIMPLRDLRERVSANEIKTGHIEWRVGKLEAR